MENNIKPITNGLIEMIKELKMLNDKDVSEIINRYIVIKTK